MDPTTSTLDIPFFTKNNALKICIQSMYLNIISCEYKLTIESNSVDTTHAQVMH